MHVQSTGSQAYAKDRVVTQLKTVETEGCVISKSKAVLETWLAGLRRTTPISAMGVALLALQIAELENRCAAMRRRTERKAASAPNLHSKKTALRSAA